MLSTQALHRPFGLYWSPTRARSAGPSFKKRFFHFNHEVTVREKEKKKPMQMIERDLIHLV